MLRYCMFVYHAIKPSPISTLDVSTQLQQTFSLERASSQEAPSNSSLDCLELWVQSDAIMLPCDAISSSLWEFNM